MSGLLASRRTSLTRNVGSSCRAWRRGDPDLSLLRAREPGNAESLAREVRTADGVAGVNRARLGLRITFEGLGARLP
jgi:hypothetical protein